MNEEVMLMDPQLQDRAHALKPQIDAALAKLTRLDAPTGIVYHPLLHTLDDPKFSCGAETHVSLTELMGILYELRDSSIGDTNIPETAALVSRAFHAKGEGEVPMAMVSFDYHAVTTGAVGRFLAELRSTGSLDLEKVVPAKILEKRRVVISRPLIDTVLRGAKVVFSFDEAWRLSNDGQTPRAIRFDAGDGHGPRDVSLGSRVPVSYSTLGVKRIAVSCEYADGVTTTISELRVKALTLPDPNEKVKVQAERPYEGVTAKGTMKVYYAEGHSNVVKPFFYWTGFAIAAGAASADPEPLWGRSMTADDAFADPTTAAWLDDVRNAGYDIVVVEFDDTRTYIQANGELVATVMTNICQRPTRTDPGVLVTGSMGGLIARYALLRLERDGTRTGITQAFFLDSPFGGAVVPMGVQFALDNFAGKSGAVKQARDEILNSIAARQMLVQKYVNPWSKQPTPDPLFVVLQATFRVLGNWPKNMALYAASSGNNAGKGQQKQNGETLKPKDDLTYVLYKAKNAYTTLRAAPNQVEGPGTLVFEGQPPHGRGYVEKSLPWDTCPGGTYGFAGMFSGQWPERYVHAPNTCFVPTMSALAARIEDDLHYIVRPEDTPFIKFYSPAENQAHASVTAENVAWMKNILGIAKRASD